MGMGTQRRVATVVDWLLGNEQVAWLYAMYTDGEDQVCSLDDNRSVAYPSKWCGMLRERTAFGPLRRQAEFCLQPSALITSCY